MESVARRAMFSGLILLAGAISSPAGEAARIVIDDLEFSPRVATVRRGDTVTWINRDIVEHTATANDGAFDVLTPKGKPARWRASKVGELVYYCRLHPNMTGVLRVTP